ncbi:MAG: hypothetical protein V4714_16820 [Bacteroidota bacterium]
MENLDKKSLLELASHKEAYCISVYLPTHRKGHEVNEGYDFILFKNHLQKLRADLQQRGLKSQEVENLLAPLNELLHDNEFWKNQSEGLAVFRSAQVFHYFQSPIPFEEFSQVNNQFLLQPLLPLFNCQKPYHILHLTKNGATLFNADQYAISKVDTQELFPAGLEEITQTYEFEKQYQGRVLGSGEGNAASRGDTTEFNNEKDFLLPEYFRGINEGIRQLMGDENTPLVLASVEYYHPIYRQANTYSKLFAKGLTGNFEHVPTKELHRLANELLADYFVEPQNKRIERYQNSSGTDLTSTDLRQILEAAVTGRIDTVFIKKTAQVWGRFDEQNLKATIHDDYHENDEQLLNKLALLTIQNGGEAYLMDDVDLVHTNGSVLVAALYRRDA